MGVFLRFLICKTSFTLHKASHIMIDVMRRSEKLDKVYRSAFRTILNIYISDGNVFAETVNV